jgi:hypothetical protein
VCCCCCRVLIDSIWRRSGVNQQTSSYHRINAALTIGVRGGHREATAYNACLLVLVVVCGFMVSFDLSLSSSSSVLSSSTSSSMTESLMPHCAVLHTHLWPTLRLTSHYFPAYRFPCHFPPCLTPFPLSRAWQRGLGLGPTVWGGGMGSKASYSFLVHAATVWQGPQRKSTSLFFYLLYHTLTGSYTRISARQGQTYSKCT